MTSRFDLQLTGQQIRLIIAAIDIVTRQKLFPDRYAPMEYKLLKEYLEYIENHRMNRNKNQVDSDTKSN